MNRILRFLALSSLATTSVLAQPAPQSSEYLKTTGGGALIEHKDSGSSVYFSLQLEWNKTPPPGAFLVAEFENKQNAAAPYLVEKQVSELDPKPILNSPIYPCIVNNSRYTILVKIYSDSSKQTPLGTHDQQLAFSLPRQILRDLKLKECGALYLSNDRSEK